MQTLSALTEEHKAKPSLTFSDEEVSLSTCRYYHMEIVHSLSPDGFAFITGSEANLAKGPFLGKRVKAEITGS